MLADRGREAEVRHGRGRNGDRGNRLTKIFLFAISVIACTVDKAQTSGLGVVVVRASRGDVQET